MANRHKPLPERFWANVQKSDGCWEWTAALSTNGYGMIQADGKSRIASRLCYQLVYGDFDRALCVLHKCDNRKCVRPDHLFLGTIRDNMVDMHAKNRHNRVAPLGEKNGRHKVTLADVRTIRHLYWAERRRQIEIAEFFGINHSQVSNIVNRVHWKNE